jgi:hypothetical protein
MSGKPVCGRAQDRSNVTGCELPKGSVIAATFLVQAYEVSARSGVVLEIIRVPFAAMGKILRIYVGSARGGNQNTAQGTPAALVTE